MRKETSVGLALAWRLLPLLVITAMTGVERVHAQCAAPIWSEYSSAVTNKVGFNPCTNDTPPIVRYYLTQTEQWHTFLSTFGDNGYPGQGLSVGQWEETKKDVTVADWLTGIQTSTWSGTASYTVNPDPTDDSYSGKVADPSSGAWDINGGSIEQYEQQQFKTESEWPHLLFQMVTVTNNICTPTTYSDQTSVEVSGNYDADDYNYAYIKALSSEFTDDTLRKKVMLELPPYPNQFSSGGASATWWMDVTHGQGGGTKMKYEYHLCGDTTSQKGVQFLVSWIETKLITVGSSVFQSNSTPQSVMVTGNGDPNGMYTPFREVDVPACLPYLTNYSVTIYESDSAYVTLVPNNGGGGPSGGGTAGGGGPGPGGPGPGGLGGFGR